MVTFNCSYMGLTDHVNLVSREETYLKKHWGSW